MCCIHLMAIVYIIDLITFTGNNKDGVIVVLE